MASFLFGLTLWLGSLIQQPQEVQKVACLGDSITFGARLVQRQRHAYPQRLQEYLGGEFEVRNFGSGGRTMLVPGDLPYAKSSALNDALAWRPQVAILMLGTNDTCQNQNRTNWQHQEQLESSARQLVQTLRQVREAMQIYLCTPPAMFPHAPNLAPERQTDLSQRSLRLPRIRQAYRRVAAQDPRIHFVDLSGVLQQNQVVDGVHPNPFGADALAAFMAEMLQARFVPRPAWKESLQAQDLAWEATDFHGFTEFQFSLRKDSVSCRLVVPDQCAIGRPWIWRARFWNHQPELDMALLTRGFCLAYCDVSDLYGGLEAVDRWNRFYALSQKLGLHPKPILEGMSRGGLPVLQWAGRNPEKVGAIYLDNAVVDPRSWPGGQNGKFSESDWQALQQVYGEKASLGPPSDWTPWAQIPTLAHAQVPIMVVVGDQDEVVPPAENGLALVHRYRALQAPATLWRKPRQGHHPHGLHPVAPLLRHLLYALDRQSNPATRAISSVEYRGQAAGWGEGNWWQQLQRNRQLASDHPEMDLVFLGDSITQGLTGAHQRLSRPEGSRLFDRFYGHRRAVSLGLSGDRTEHLLFRIEHGALAIWKPKVIVLAIGVNNVQAAGHTGEETAAGIRAVVQSLRRKQKQATILVCGPFPAGASPPDPRRRALDRVHQGIAGLGLNDPKVLYLDLRPSFLTPTGELNHAMSKDQIHLNEHGREIWMQALEPWLQQLLKE